MKTTLPVKLPALLFALMSIVLVKSAAAQTPELVFKNPVLSSGHANSEGAVYRFNNVTTGVDAEVKLKKFSRPDISMSDVDLASLGWDKAFQPQFGIPGNVAPGQNWYIDFEISFLKGGTNKKQKINRFDLTSLDVDGDGVSIAEYVNMEKPDSVAYSSVSYLTGGGGGTQNFVCPEDGLLSPIIVCPFCLLGITILGEECSICDGNGKIFQLCQHPFMDELEIHGPVTNFYNIDTAATQVMATYTYLQRDKIKFRIGATSGSASSSAGVRLNSMWFRSFSLTTVLIPLPVKLTAFTAVNNQGGVDLKWKAASELNFDHYELERSLDGKFFSALTNVKGRNKDWEDGADYKFLDQAIPSGATSLYYRLKLVDLDGKIDYSPTRKVTIDNIGASTAVSVYPNPVLNDFQVKIPEALQGKNLNIELYNNNGQVIMRKTANAAGQLEAISGRELGKGLYTMRISSGTVAVQAKLVKI